MEDFWTRPTGVYAKPVWLRDGVLQLFYDDDNSEMKSCSGATVPGGHAVFTRSAAVYSSSPFDDAETTLAADPATEGLRNQVAAFVQRAGSCYFVEAGLLGFADPAAGESAGLDEQSVLSSAIKWALSDFEHRHGSPPKHVVLHVDVNGSLSLGDVASTKSFGQQALGLAADILKRHEKGQAPMTPQTQQALERAKTLDEEALKQEYTTYYRDADFVAALEHCAGILSAQRPSHEPSSSPAELTVAIRTNGVEAENAALYLQKLFRDRLGVSLTEEAGTLKRYVVTHVDRERGLVFHPVLLEKFAKSKGYDLETYVRELREILGINNSLEAWRGVSDSSLKKSDPKFKVYLGLCSAEDEKPAGHSTIPPLLEPVFKRETWLTPGAAVEQYKLQSAFPGAAAPWWANFGQRAPRSNSWHLQWCLRVLLSGLSWCFLCVPCLLHLDSSAKQAQVLRDQYSEHPSRPQESQVARSTTNAPASSVRVLVEPPGIPQQGAGQ